MSVPETMRALIQKGDGYAKEHSGSVLEAMQPYVEEATVPVPRPGAGQVLVKVARGAINPSDVMFIKGLYGQPRRQGQPAGFEGSGTVVATGAGTEALAGRRIAFIAAGSGSWAEYALVDAAMAIPLMPGVSDEDGAAMIVNPLTALAMFDIVREEGEKSFILTAGASQLCKLIIGLARDEGYRPIAIVRRDDQTELLIRHGAAHVLNAAAPGFERAIAALCREEKPRIMLDASTGPAASTIFNAMGRRSRWIVYGRLDTAATVIREPGQLIFQAKRVEGFWLAEWLRSAPMEKKAAAGLEAQKRFADGRWKTDVTAVVPLKEAMARVPEELARPNGKVFIAP
ncbi:MAG: zinc-binding dehydrogenase [Rhizobiaceae bacterium]|nr:zinc-binding dehydrogenase [Rhizobiaceae bacterium]